MQYHPVPSSTQQCPTVVPTIPYSPCPTTLITPQYHPIPKKYLAILHRTQRYLAEPHDTPSTSSNQYPSSTLCTQQYHIVCNSTIPPPYPTLPPRTQQYFEYPVTITFHKADFWEYKLVWLPSLPLLRDLL